MTRRAGEVATPLSKVLAVGVLAAVAILLVGMVLVFAGGADNRDVDLLAYPNAAYRFDPAELLQGAMEGDAAAVLELGVFALVMTPILRVVAAGFLFARAREWVFAVVSLLVLVIITAAWWGVV